MKAVVQYTSTFLIINRRTFMVGRVKVARFEYTGKKIASLTFFNSVCTSSIHMFHVCTYRSAARMQVYVDEFLKFSARALAPQEISYICRGMIWWSNYILKFWTLGPGGRVCVCWAFITKHIRPHSNYLHCHGGTGRAADPILLSETDSPIVWLSISHQASEQASPHFYPNAIVR